MYHQSSFWLSGERADINKRGREPFWPPRPSCEFFKNHLVTGPGGWLMMILALRMAMQCFLLSQIHITSLLTFPHQSDLKTQIKTARYTYLSIFLSIKKSGFSLAFGCLSLRETPKNSKWENQSNNRIVIVFEMQEKFNFLMEIYNIHILCRKT